MRERNKFSKSVKQRRTTKRSKNKRNMKEGKQKSRRNAMQIGMTGKIFRKKRTYSRSLRKES